MEISITKLVDIIDKLPKKLSGTNLLPTKTEVTLSQKEEFRNPNNHTSLLNASDHKTQIENNENQQQGLYLLRVALAIISLIPLFGVIFGMILITWEASEGRLKSWLVIISGVGIIISIIIALINFGTPFFNMLGWR